MKKIGILGGGQLGRMLIQAGIDLNIEFAVADPDAKAPCRPLAHEFAQGSLLDYDTVLQFGKNCDIVTIEIEKVNVDALEALERAGVRVFPQAAVIRIIQDKRSQKLFFQEHGFPTADFVLLENRENIYQHTDFLPAFQKLARDGYDGKGVVSLSSVADIAHKAFDQWSILERAVAVHREISVIVARNEQGEVSCFPVVEMVFNPEYHLVDYLISPANITIEQEKIAEDLARRIIEKLEMVGILAVEMFIDESGKVVVNELAPRPHNSGHHTIKANYTSQYDQHLRAILGLPLGNTAAHSCAGMVNILGAEGYRGQAVYKGIETVFHTEGAYLHLYGKSATAPARKMGHITILAKNSDMLLEKIEKLRKAVRVEA